MLSCRIPSRGTAALPVLLLLAALTGCVNYAAPMTTAEPMPMTPTRVADDLEELPAPQEQVVAAVYRFRDQTGQYKSSETVASWSTAVTQGATSILMRALEESGWFVPIEREGLSNLLNERQIIQSIRAQYEGPEGESLGALPPLLYAGVLLEGGIIGYDTNIVTSGIGARYFGAGGSGQTRRDQVTVYLRAVSTQTGRVLKTVSTTKTIASQQVDGGIFRFVEVDRLLESEIGYSTNEPPVVAVTEAIQEAVKNLIIEGVREGLWALADASDIQNPVFAAYDEAVEEAATLDAFGFTSIYDRSGFGFSVNGGAKQYDGNYRDPLSRPAAELGARWMFSPRWGLGLAASVGNIGAEDVFEVTSAAVEGHSFYYLLPRARTSPFLRLGAGLLIPSISGSANIVNDNIFPYLSLGGGAERMVTASLGLNLTLSNQFSLSDEIDHVTEGSGNDSVWNLTTGFTFYP